jgi:hypothetical protein
VCRSHSCARERLDQHNLSDAVSRDFAPVDLQDRDVVTQAQERGDIVGDIDEVARLRRALQRALHERVHVVAEVAAWLRVENHPPPLTHAAVPRCRRDRIMCPADRAETADSLSAKENRDSTASGPVFGRTSSPRSGDADDLAE